MFFCRFSLLSFVVVSAFAAPLDQATVAIMRLAEVPNYTWTSAVSDDARSYNKQGKHDRRGYTWVTLPMLESIARRLGREAGTDFEAIFASSGECVIRLGGRWKTVRQLPKARDEDRYLAVYSPPRLRTPDMPADLAEVDPFPSVIVVTPPPRRDDEPNRPYSNARLAASPPHEELALIVSSWENVVVNGDTVTGRIGDTGSRLLLCPGNEHESTPLLAAGEFALTLKDNCVARYRLTLEGILAIGKKKRVLVRQVADTAITQVGTTALVLPDEARLKLGP